jgi:uncharacterized protein YcaQ
MAAIPVSHARRLLLAAQGLMAPQPKTPGTKDVLAAIRRMHALQIDTINVVARSPYLVLWSRLGDYEPRLLDKLLADHEIFEHWSHAACFLDMADYPLYRRMMLEPARRRKTWYHWAESHEPLMERVLAQIRESGPVRSSDFDRPAGRRGAGWWDWKEEKAALEMLNTRGDVMITARHNFQRIYDLRENVLPDWDDSMAPPAEEAQRELTLRAVRALGVARPAWVATNLQSLFLGLQATGRRMAELGDEGLLTRVEVEGWAGPAYVHPDNLPILESRPRHSQPRTTLLSPFDPLTWDRARALDVFGFDYRIESYTPAPKRKYGYFTLPILHGDALVGRLDPKAHRKLGVFEVKSVHLEPDVAVTAELVDGIRDALQRLAAWHKTPEVIVRWSNPASLMEALGFAAGPDIAG